MVRGIDKFSRRYNEACEGVSELIGSGKVNFKSHPPTLIKVNIVNGMRQYVGRLIRLEFYMRSTKEEQGWILCADLDEGLWNTDYGIQITD